MTITQEIFQRWCSSAQNPIGDYGVFDSIAGHLRQATAVLMSMLGTDLYYSLTDEAVDDIDDPAHGVAAAAQQYLCLDAYDRAIPHLDLTLSPTGFGVVSNANVAPASADRVERLRKEVRYRRDEAFDDLLDALRGKAAWCNTPLAIRYFALLVWRCRHLSSAGYPDADRRTLVQLFPLLMQAQTDLAHMLGPDQIEAWTAMERLNNAGSADAIAIDLARIYICCVAAESGEDARRRARQALLAYVESHIELFPAYRGSSAYEANHYEPYTNKKDDTSYFFG